MKICSLLNILAALIVILSPAAKSQSHARVGETTVHALGSLLASKVQGDMKFDIAPDTSMFYREMIMIYRAEVISCNGFLDSLDVSVITKISQYKWIEILNDDVAALEIIRAFEPDLDAKAKVFAKENFFIAIDHFSKGEWHIVPPCMTNRYQSNLKN
jgi:hypothetical protein